MRLDIPLRLAATGIAGLAALSATHWVRENVGDPEPVLAFTLGVLPNLAAAFAMPLILASFTPQVIKPPFSGASRAAFVWLLLFTTFGLVGWEFLQANSAAFVFDVYDLVATGAGSVLALIAFLLHLKFHAANRS